MLNDRQQEIYDLIMNIETCYNMYLCGDFESAIIFAKNKLERNGYPVWLDGYEFDYLKDYLEDELKEEEM